MKKSVLIYILTSVILIVCMPSCVSNMLEEPEPADFCDTIDATYNGDVMDIVDSSCSYNGCHDGSGGLGPGDYTTYNGMQSRFGLFRSRIIEFQTDPGIGMPPDNSVYQESQKDNLSMEEMEVMICWINAGFPEN